jgi:hypothetical protein
MLRCSIASKRPVLGSPERSISRRENVHFETYESLTILRKIVSSCAHETQHVKDVLRLV